MLKKALCVLSVSLLLISVPSATFALPDRFAVSAKACVVIEMQSGRILYAHNAHGKLPMASTTKIMTALLALEQDDIDEYFTVDADAIMVEGTSMGLRAGDSVSLRTLAIGMLLPSGNDGANAAASRIAGSISAFAKMMNERAQEIGMYNTNFVTPSGLDAEGHYSSAYDMAMLAREALANPDFLDICSKQSAAAVFGNPPYRRTLSNHNRLLSSYSGAIGVKTGFTSKAGRCLVSAAQRDGITLICVTLNCSDDWNIHRSMFDRYFGQLTVTELGALLPSMRADVTGGVQTSVLVQPYQMPTAPLIPGEIDSVTGVVEIQQFLYAPVKKGDVVGKASFYLKSDKLCVVDLIAADDVELLHPYEENLLDEVIDEINESGFFNSIKKFFTRLFGGSSD